MQIGVIKHEVSHIIFGHLTMDKYYDNHTWLNYAADLEVNSYIPVLQVDPFYYPGKFKMSNGQGTKWYYDNLKEYAEKAGYEIVYEEFDSHKFWKDFIKLPSAEQEVIKYQIEGYIKNVAEQTKKGCGNIPGQFEEYINGLFKENPPIFNWKKYFRRSVQNSIESSVKQTKYRPSKRFKDQPGNCIKFKPNVLVAVDTSGSISDDDLRNFFTEIDYLHKTGMCVDIIEFDTCITNKFTYKNKNQDIKICGRGGTDVTEAWKYYIQHKEYSTFVIFTDGYLSYQHLPHCNNVIWVISSTGQTANYPGTSIYMPEWN